jgi:hypothetical protein
MTDRDQFSVKIPEWMEEEIEAFGEESHRTKSNALIHLMSVGASASEEHVEASGDGPGVKKPISVSTEFTDAVESVRELADDEFDGTFSQAVRWSIRNGIEEVGWEI